MTNLDHLKLYVKEDLNLQDNQCIFFELNEELGVIYCDSAVEALDEHCDKCRNELLPFKFNASMDREIVYLMVSVGETKFNKIKSGYYNFDGLSLKDAKILS